MVIRETNLAQGLDASAVSPPNYLSWTERASSLELTAFGGQSLTWTGGEYPERLEALAPTVVFLAVVEAPLHLGRWFTADEGRAGQHRVAVLSHRVWRTRFGAESGVLGQSLVLNGFPYTVIGVASPDWIVPSAPDLWVPQVFDPAGMRRGNRYLSVFGRLRPGVTRDRAQAELAAIAAGLAAEFPDSNKGYGVSVVPLAESMIPVETRTALLALAASAAIVLLIACANVGNVLLSKAVARRREMAIRAALGAGAARLTRQVLTESLLLSMTGAALAVLGSAAVIGAARQALAGVIPRIEDVTLNVPVLVFALSLAIATGLAFGCAPLWHLGRTRRLDLLHAAGWGDRVPGWNPVRAGLVVGQVSLTTVLLVGAGLLIQSLVKLQTVPAGIDADSVLTAKLTLTRARLANGAAISQFLSRLTEDLRAARGVSAAGISSAIPLSPGAFTIMQAGADASALVTCEWRLVDAGYFRTLRIPVLRGRLFEPQDGADAPRVFVVSQQMAQALYPGEDPVGRPLRLQNGTVGEIIGVVADVRMRQLGEPPERVVWTFRRRSLASFPCSTSCCAPKGSRTRPRA